MPPLQQDIQKPFDPTGYADITGAQLAQYLDGAFPATDKGMAILTTDTAGVPEVPDAATTTKWQRYLWVRQSVSSVGLYVWNNNAATDPTYLKWQSVNIAGIGAGSIVNNMIADNTIQDVKIVSLSYSKITGAPSGLPPSGAAGGDLTGTYPNPSIGALKVLTANIADIQITTAKIVDLNITVGKMAGNGVAKDMQRTAAGLTSMEFFTPPVVFTSGIVVPTANALKIPQVNAGATDFQMVAPRGANLIGDVLQVLSKACAAASTTTILPYDTTIPQVGEGAEIATLTITPKSATSLLKFTFHYWGACSVVQHVVALFSGASANAIHAVAGCQDGTATRPFVGSMGCVIASPGIVATTYSVRFGPGQAGTAYIFRDSSGTIFGAAATGFFTIEEIVGTLS